VNGAVHALGAYGGPEASRVLIQRLQKATLAEESARLSDNILFARRHVP
jgi:hypothetical protein